MKTRQKQEDVASITDEDNSPLFRPQVVAEQQTQWLGKVLLTPSIPHYFFALFAILVATSITAFLFLGDFTRKERIAGWLVPQHGLVQVYTPLSGIVSHLSVQDGSEVKSGDPLLIVSAELQSEALGATQQEIVRRLKRRRDSLISEMDLNARLFEQQSQDLTEQVAATREEFSHRKMEIKIQQQRVELAEESVKRLGEHRGAGVVSTERWLESENARLDQTLSLRRLQRDSETTHRARLKMEAQLNALPLENRKDTARIIREIDTLEQELAEAEARRQIVLTAPQSGTVTTLQLEPGSNVKSTLPLLSIIPAGSELVAQLYIPTRAIGFIKPGQSVLLRYRAFPYQKFGHYQGTIASVSRSTINRADLSPGLRGATDQQNLNEPVYPVTVHLANQSVNAYGQAIALQPGMELEADILIENRRLIEWVLEPLYTLTGKMQS